MMETNEKLIISDRAMETIERESRRHPKVETGGLLVGKRRSDRVIITHATGPGPEAELEPERFHKDTRYLQEALNLLFGYFGVNYLGTWHKHPPDLDHPSNLDVASAKDELNDKDIGLERLLLPICLLKEDNSVEFKPYFVDKNGFRAYEQDEWEVATYTSLSQALFGGLQWYQTPDGNQRLKEELSLFESGGIEAEVKKASDGAYSFFTTVPQNSEKLVFSCPADFPVGPPEVVRFDPTTLAYSPVTFDKLTAWDMHLHLVDIVNMIDEQ